MVRLPPRSTLFPTRRSSDLPSTVTDVSATLVVRTTLRRVRGKSAASCCSGDRKSTRLNSSHTVISYAVFCLKKKTSYQANAHTSRDKARHKYLKRQTLSS